jgi:hypothetical protein
MYVICGGKSLILSPHQKGIIKSMGHLYRMYKLVKWVDDNIKGHDTSTPEVAKRGDKYRVSGSGIRENFVKITKKDDAEVRDLTESCREEGYLKSEDEVWYIINPGKGRRFLRKFGLIPSGFLKEAFNDNYIVLSFISGILGGAIVPFAIYLISK